MATRKTDARWRLADVVMEFVIEGEPRNVVHVNTHLIEAASAEEAYHKALTIGRAGRMTYRNPYGRRVRVLLRGLEQIRDIAESLADGAALRFRQLVGVPEHAIRQRPRANRRLFASTPITEDRTVPSYMDASIVDEFGSVRVQPRDDAGRRRAAHPATGTIDDQTADGATAHSTPLAVTPRRIQRSVPRVHEAEVRTSDRPVPLG